MLTFLALAALALAATLAGVVYQKIGEARDARQLPLTGRLVEIGPRRRLHVQRSGQGRPAVVLESGIAATSLSWTRVQPLVAEFAEVCSYDRAGLGGSDPGGPTVTATGNAEALATMLRALEIPPPYVLVGHSYGGLVVLAFAARRPKDVAGLVLVDPVAPSSWAPPPTDDLRRLRGGVFLSHVGAGLARIGFVRFCLARLASGSTGVPRRVARMFGSEAAGVLDHLVGEVQKLPPETWPAVRAIWSHPKSFGGMARHLAGLPASAREVSGTDTLGDLPLVVISAGRNAEASRLEHERMAARSSRGRLIVAKNSGHWIALDQPELVVSAIRQIVNLARNPEPGTGNPL